MRRLRDGRQGAARGDDFRIKRDLDQRAELSLLSADLGWFHKLCEDYHLPGISFGRKHIHVMRDANESGMDDIRSLDSNRAAAKFTTTRVQELSADPGCALHVSIAGGRKTMGFYLGYALSLYGRPRDRLSHELVSEPFENSIDLFYPTPYSRVLQTRDGKLADTAMAEVTLDEIPFVSLRHGLSARLSRPPRVAMGAWPMTKRMKRSVP